jgi:hypothetical protein
MMSSDNPYAPSLVPAVRAHPDWPETGIFRDRHYVVKHGDVAFPALCIVTGQSTQRTERLRLQCIQANDGSLPASYHFLGEPRYVIDVPLAENWRKRRWPGIVLSFAVLGISFMGFVTGVISFVLIFQGTAERDIYVRDVLLTGGSAISFAIGIYLRDVAYGRLQLVYIDRGYYWLRGACPQFLESLPLWPG